MLECISSLSTSWNNYQAVVRFLCKLEHVHVNVDAQCMLKAVQHAYEIV